MAGVQLILMDFIGIFVISVFLKVCYFLEENTIVCLKDQQFTFSPRLADVSFVQICQPALPQQFRRIVMILKIDCACPIILLTRELLCGGHFTPDWHVTQDWPRRHAERWLYGIPENASLLRK